MRTRLRNLMTSKAGTPYRAENLDNDIKALYESGLVDDVRFLAEPVGDGVNLIAEVTTRPVLGGVGFVGNTIFTDQKLAKETKLKAGGVLSDAADSRSPPQHREILSGLRLSGRDGHPPHPGDRPGRTVRSDFRHRRGPEERGPQDHASKATTPSPILELRKEMKMKEKGWFSWLTKSGRFESDQLDTDLDAILDYYRSKGYLRASSPGIRREPVRRRPRGPGHPDQRRREIHGGRRRLRQDDGFQTRGTLSVADPRRRTTPTPPRRCAPTSR